MKQIGFIIAVVMAVLLQAGRASAVAVGGCGLWYSPGGDVTVEEDLLLDSGTTCQYELLYTDGMTPGEPVDLVFAALPGTTYTFTTFIPGSIYNATLFTWDDYHFELGSGHFGSPDTFANFGGAAATPVFIMVGSNGTTSPFSDVFPTVSFSSHSLGFAGGEVASLGGDVNFRVTVAVPTTFTAQTFTLRQSFSVPEPATLALPGLGLAGLAASRRRKR